MTRSLVRPSIAAALLVVALGCSGRSGRDAHDTTDPRALTAREVRWAIEMPGRPLALTALSGGDTAFVRSFTSWPNAFPCWDWLVVERLRGDGQTVWFWEPPEKAIFSGLAAGSADETFVAFARCSEDSMTSVGTSLASITPEGSVAWQVDVTDEFLGGIAGAPDGGVLAIFDVRGPQVSWDTPGPLLRTVLRRYAADGSVVSERDIPGGARLDGPGAYTVPTESRIERWSLDGALLMAVDAPSASARLAEVVQLDGGSVAVLGFFQRTFSWGNVEVRYEPDAWFTPAQFVVVLDAQGHAVWATSRANGLATRPFLIFAWRGVLAGPEGGLVTVLHEGGDGECTEPLVRAFDAGGAISWERLLPIERCAGSEYSEGGASISAAAIGNGTLRVAGEFALGGEAALRFGDDRLRRGSSYVGEFELPSP